MCRSNLNDPVLYFVPERESYFQEVRCNLVQPSTQGACATMAMWDSTVTQLDAVSAYQAVAGLEAGVLVISNKCGRHGHMVLPRGALDVTQVLSPALLQREFCPIVVAALRLTVTSFTMPTDLSDWDILPAAA